jgi:hypothetical protein
MDACIVVWISRNTNTVQLRNRIYYFNVYWRLNMFWAANRSSSGALNCICRLWFIYQSGDWPLPRLNGKWNNKFYYKAASCWYFLLGRAKIYIHLKLYSKFKIQNTGLTLKNRRGVLEVRRRFLWWQAKSQYQKQKVLLDYCQLILKIWTNDRKE